MIHILPFCPPYGLRVPSLAWESTISHSVCARVSARVPSLTFDKQCKVKAKNCAFHFWK